MAEQTITEYSQQHGITVDKLLDYLEAAGISGKQASDVLTSDEKLSVLAYLRTNAGNTLGARDSMITISKKTVDSIRQTSRSGASRTIHVEVRKKRKFLQRSQVKPITSDESQSADLVTSDLTGDAGSSNVVNKDEPNAALVDNSANIAGEEVLAKTEIDSTICTENSASLASKDSEITPDEVVTGTTDVKDVGGAGKGKETKTGVVDQAAKGSGKASAGGKKAQDDAPSKDKKPKIGRKTRFAEERRQLHVRAGGRRPRPTTIRPKKVTSSSQERHGFERPVNPIRHTVMVPETISVAELAQTMSVKSAEVIKALMNMGSMVSINQVLDQETALIVVEEMGHVGVAGRTDDPEELLEDSIAETGELSTRPPVVTVMGHVDHGKTSLLDYLRKSTLTAAESGGITQHIGAYQVKTPTGMITFLDTPGHEAFSAMRARGSKVTDIVVLVVAADDGIKPQTIEAITHAKNADVPIIVAINKIDKAGVDLDRIKQELGRHGVIAEDWGGETMIAAVSAKTGAGMDDLLERISLQADLMDLKAYQRGRAKGVVIEARIDRGWGPVASILVQSGKLKTGDVVLAGTQTGRVRALINDAGKTVESATPSVPVDVLGIGGLSQVGDELTVLSDERKAREIALFRQGKFKEIRLAGRSTGVDDVFAKAKEEQGTLLNLLIKADVQGSVEALTESLEKLANEEVQVKVIHGMVGAINESDVNLAIPANAIIIAFKVRADNSARRLSESEGVQIRNYNVIYDVVDDIRKSLSGLMKPEIKENILGLVEVRETYKSGKIAGCFVSEGIVKRNGLARLLRDNTVIYDSRVDTLKRIKDDVTEVKSGLECGLTIKNFADIKVNDRIEVYEKVLS